MSFGCDFFAIVVWWRNDATYSVHLVAAIDSPHGRGSGQPERRQNLEKNRLKMMGGDFSNVTNEAIMPAWRAMLNRVVFLEEVHDFFVVDGSEIPNNHRGCNKNIEK